MRIYIDSSALENWPLIKDWFLHLKPKKQQDKQLLERQIRRAGHRICDLQAIKVQPSYLERRSRGPIVICPSCGEAYPSNDNGLCLACQGATPYLEVQGTSNTQASRYEFDLPKVNQKTGL